MKLLALLILVFMAQATLAEVTDANLQCSNLKGEIIINSHIRVEKESLKIYENGGFAIYGQMLTVSTSRGGALGIRPIVCGAELDSATTSTLVTCATGSQIQFLNKILPPIRTGCR